jgi:U3 small nucleolar RNA-associated protein 18
LAGLIQLVVRFRFEKVNPTPTWAKAARDKLHKRPKRRRPSTSSTSSSISDKDAGEDNDIDADVDNLLHSTSGILAASGRGLSKLPSTTLAVERLRDANQAARSDGGIKCLRFHPSPSVPVLLTAGGDRRLRLFNVRLLTLVMTNVH